MNHLIPIYPIFVPVYIIVLAAIGMFLFAIEYGQCLNDEQKFINRFSKSNILSGLALWIVFILPYFYLFARHHLARLLIAVLGFAGFVAYLLVVVLNIRRYIRLSFPKSALLLRLSSGVILLTAYLAYIIYLTTSPNLNLAKEIPYGFLFMMTWIIAFSGFKIILASRLGTEEKKDLFLAEKNKLRSLGSKFALGIFAFLFVLMLFSNTVLANEFVFIGFVIVIFLVGFVISIKAELGMLEFYGLPAGYIRDYKWLHIFSFSTLIVVSIFLAILQNYFHWF